MTNAKHTPGPWAIMQGAILIDGDCPRDWLFAEAYVVDNPDRSDIGEEAVITNTTDWCVVDNVGDDQW